MKQGVKKLIVFLFILLLILSPIFIYGILSVVLKTRYPAAVINSNSMAPYIEKGDMVLSKGINKSTDIREGTIEDQDGDVIIFNAKGLWDDAPDEPIIHRVVGKWLSNDTWYFKTKGDANDFIDPVSIPKEKVLGVVKRVIPYVGWGKIILFQVSFFIQILIFIGLIAFLLKYLRKLKL
jgi:signal peptidase I